jgi:hypothetical protein
VAKAVGVKPQETASCSHHFLHDSGGPEMSTEQIDDEIGDGFDEEEVNAIYCKSAEKLLETSGK